MKRRTMLAVAAVALLFVLSAGAAFALTKTCGGGDCVGTVEDDQLTGTNSSDRIAGLEGNDTIDGRFGPDEIFGGEGNDFIIDNVAQNATDNIFGGSGNDTIDVKDDQFFADFVDCGGGKRDEVFFDQGQDTIAKNCEVKRGS